MPFEVLTFFKNPYSLFVIILEKDSSKIRKLIIYLENLEQQ